MKLAIRIIGVILILALLLAMLEPSFVIVPAQMAMALGLGWLFSAQRLLHDIGNHSSSIALWSIGLLIFLFGIHAFLKAVKPTWPFRWTALLAAALWISLLSTMALIGVTHQLAWMNRTKERFFVSGKSLRLLVKANHTTHLARQAEWKEAPLRQSLADAPDGLAWENYNVLMQTDGHGNVTNLLIIDRTGQSGFIAAGPTQTSTRQPIEKIGLWLPPGE